MSIKLNGLCDIILFTQIDFSLNYILFSQIIFKLNYFTRWIYNYSIFWFWEFFPCILIFAPYDRLGIVERGSPRKLVYYSHVSVYFQLFKFYIDLDWFKTFLSCKTFLIWFNCSNLFQSCLAYIYFLEIDVAVKLSWVGFGYLFLLNCVIHPGMLIFHWNQERMWNTDLESKREKRENFMKYKGQVSSIANSSLYQILYNVF